MDSVCFFGVLAGFRPGETDAGCPATRAAGVSVEW